MSRSDVHLERYAHMPYLPALYWMRHKLFQRCEMCNRHMAVASQTMQWNHVKDFPAYDRGGVIRDWMDDDGSRNENRVLIACCSEHCRRNAIELMVAKRKFPERLERRKARKWHLENQKQKRLAKLLHQAKLALRQNRLDLLPSLQREFKREATSRR